MSKYLAISLIIVTLVVGLTGGFFIASNSNPNTSMKEGGVFASQLRLQIETAGNDGLYSDQEYLSEMIEHHEDAVEMSKRVLAHTSRQEIRQMSASIIEVQTQEIAQMRSWLSEWK